jgi:hypothetical protein
MKSILNTIVIITTILAGLAGIFGVYIQSTTNIPIIEIKTISSDKLTNLPNLDGLNANYTYKNKPVKSLWKLHYKLSNIGNETIIGEGNNKNIIKDNIKFSLANNFRILELHIPDEEYSFKFHDNKILFSFLQWRPSENMNIIIYVEQLNNENIPTLITNDREIINGEIKYSSLLDEVNNNELTLFYQMPQLFQIILWWFSIILFGFIIIIMPIYWIGLLIENRDFNKWKKEHKESYSQFVSKLIEEKHLEEYHNPNYLPYDLWDKYQYAIPKIPSDNMKDVSIATIAVIGISLIPLLLLIKL